MQRWHKRNRRSKWSNLGRSDDAWLALLLLEERWIPPELPDIGGRETLSAAGIAEKPGAPQGQNGYGEHGYVIQ